MPEQLERILRVTNVWKKNLPISVTEHGYIWGLIVLEIYQADFFSGWELTISPARPILQFVEALRDS